MLSFIPAGMPRTIAEYIVATIPGAVLLFIFFVVAEGALFFTKSDIISILFLPVVCILPVFAGMASALALERVRNRGLTFKSGALVGVLAGFFGALVSALMLGILAFLNQSPFGSIVSDKIIIAAALLMILAIDTILGALGGAIVVKFIKDI